MKKFILFMSIMLCCIIPFTAFAETVAADAEETTVESEENTDVLDVEEARQIIEYHLELNEPIVTYQITEEEYNKYNDGASMFVSGSAYEGSFNSTALNYFIGVMMNNIGKDYVAYRASQYVYYLFWGDDITYSDPRFTGSDLNYIMYSSYDGNFQRGTDDLSVNHNNAVVYSNVNDSFANLVEVKLVEESRVNSILIASCMLMLLFFWIWKR